MSGRVSSTLRAPDVDNDAVRSSLSRAVRAAAAAAFLRLRHGVVPERSSSVGG